MEWAYLYTSVVNLDQERIQLQSEGHTLRAYKNILEEKYRSHSDKNGFTCPTCRNPVRMVLDTPCYFRHERDDHSRSHPSTIWQRTKKTLRQKTRRFTAWESKLFGPS